MNTQEAINPLTDTIPESQLPVVPNLNSKEQRTCRHENVNASYRFLIREMLSYLEAEHGLYPYSLSIGDDDGPWLYVFFPKQLSEDASDAQLTLADYVEVDPDLFAAIKNFFDCVGDDQQSTYIEAREHPVYGIYYVDKNQLIKNYPEPAECCGKMC